MFWDRINRWLRQPTQRTTNAHLRLNALEDRAVPTVNVAPIYAVGSGSGIDSTVKVYTPAGTLLDTFKPYPLPGGTFFQGGVHTAVGDINGDGTADIITGAAAGGGAHVKVFNGVDVAAGNPNPGVLREIFPYINFTGGVNVAVGDVNGDGLQDIVTGAGPGGGPHVFAFSNGIGTQPIMELFAYEASFLGGVNVACGDVGGDNLSDELITGKGEGNLGVTVNGVVGTIPGGQPTVKLYNFVPNANPGLTPQKLAQFDAYDSSLRCGVFVASGATSNNRDASNFLYSDIITGAGRTGGAHVKVFRLLDAINDGAGNPDWQFFTAGQVFPYSNFYGGVRVGAVRNGSFDDILTSPGMNGGPDQRAFNQQSVADLQTYTPTQRLQIFPFSGSYLGGIFVS